MHGITNEDQHSISEQSVAIVVQFISPVSKYYVTMPPMWTDDELNPPCDVYVKTLKPFVGDSSLRCLPIWSHEKEITAKLQTSRIVGMEGPTGCGKSVGSQWILYSFVSSRSTRGPWPWPILLAQRQVFAAAKIANALYERFDWLEKSVHLKTGQHDTNFQTGAHEITVTTYGLLFKWLTSGEDLTWVPGRYHGFILDEFVDLTPKEEEASRILGNMVQRSDNNYQRCHIVMSSSLSMKEVISRFGQDITFTQIDKRQFTLHRCIVAPKEETNLLMVGVHLVRMAVERRAGDVILFLPGIAEILTSKKMLVSPVEGSVYKLKSCLEIYKYTDISISSFTFFSKTGLNILFMISMKLFIVA